MNDYNSPMFVDHPQLHRKQARQRLMNAARELVDHASPEDVTGSAEAEDILFKGMHAAGYAARRRNGRPAGEDESRAALRLHRRILDLIVNANMGLVYEMRRRSGIRDGDGDEYVSMGLWALYRAALGFNPWRGNRFSTYACNAIIRGYWRVRKQSTRRRRVLQDFMEANAERVATNNTREHKDLTLLRDRLAIVLDANAADLTPTERFIIERRFLRPKANKPDTLESIGGLIRLSKERVRQIQTGALYKLRETLIQDPAVRSAIPAHCA